MRNDSTDVTCSSHGGNEKYVQNFNRKTERMKPLFRPRRRRWDVKMYFKEMRVSSSELDSSGSE